MTTNHDLVMLIDRARSALVLSYLDTEESPHHGLIELVADLTRVLRQHEIWLPTEIGRRVYVPKLDMNGIITEAIYPEFSIYFENWGELKSPPGEDGNYFTEADFEYLD